jgi:ornithine cyclodeaminase/alanine dehydrogenase-like protein (mu-crystallin family)
MALFLNEEEVIELLPMAECVDVLERAFSYLGEGLGDNSPRSRIRLPGGFLHFMAAASVGPDLSGFGYKAYSTFPGGSSKFLMMLYDAEAGVLLSVMEASALGQIRTGAASGLATRYMARPDASTVGIIGTGYQARTQLEAVCAVRSIKQVRAYSRTPKKREAFATGMGHRLNIEVVPSENAEECIRGVDIAITITSSREPVLKGEWMEGGEHINAAGGNHWMRREIDGEVVECADLIVVDDMEQAKIECGDLIWPAERGIFRWSMSHELKDVVSGRMSGRPNNSCTTLFESQGVAIEDVAAALHVYSKARQRGMGQELPF